MSSVKKKNYFLDATNVVSFFIVFLKIGSVLGSICDSFVVPFFAKEYQRQKQKTLIQQRFTKECKKMQRNNGAGGSRTHVQTPANIFVYNHRLCISLTVPRHITQA